MNGPNAFSFWLPVFVALGLGAGLVIFMTAALVGLAKRASLRQSLWRGCFFSLAVLILVEVSGLDSAIPKFSLVKGVAASPFEPRIGGESSLSDKFTVFVRIFNPAGLSEIQKERVNLFYFWWPFGIWLLGTVGLLIRFFVGKVILIQLKRRSQPATQMAQETWMTHFRHWHGGSRVQLCCAMLLVIALGLAPAITAASWMQPRPPLRSFHEMWPNSIAGMAVAALRNSQFTAFEPNRAVEGGPKPFSEGGVTQRPASAGAAQEMPTNAMVIFEVKFVELSDQDVSALGLDWSLNRETDSSDRSAQPNEVRAVLPIGDLALEAAAKTNQNIRLEKYGLAESDSILQGILSASQLKRLIEQLEKRPGVDILHSPQIRTAGGQQCQMRISEVKSVVTGLELTTNNPASAPNASAQYSTSSITVGPGIDLIPRLLPDGRAFHLAASFHVTEFLGYEDPKEVEAKDSSGNTIKAVVPLPRFRIRGGSAQATLEPGSTLLLGTENVAPQMLKTGSNDLVAADPSKAGPKRLLILITPHLAGPPKDEPAK